MAQRRVIVVLLLVMATVWPMTGYAQSTDPRVASAGERLTVELNEGRLVQLDAPAASVFIANPEVADITVRSARLVYVFGKRPGKTTLFALDRNDKVIADMDVVVHHGIERLKKAVETLVPSGDVTVSSIDGAIILSGAVPTAVDAENVRRLAVRFISEGEEVINQLAVTEPNQINLRVRIAEVSREVVNKFGFNWDLTYFGDNFSLGLDTRFPSVGSSSFLTGALTTGSLALDAVIDALADDQLITVLAEPNLTALSGETASFLAGGEFPIPVNEDEGTITIEFKQFGVSLAFTPTIIGPNRINMHVRPEVSQLSVAGAVTISSVEIPALTTRRAETTIEIASGQSFAIAGLILDNSQELINRTPGLSDLPVLGAFFKSERFERNETELIIIVTPYIVQPTPNRLPLPTDTFAAEAATKTAPRQATLSQTVPVPGLGVPALGAKNAARYMLD